MIILNVNKNLPGSCKAQALSHFKLSYDNHSKILPEEFLFFSMVSWKTEPKGSFMV